MSERGRRLAWARRPRGRSQGDDRAKVIGVYPVLLHGDTVTVRELTVADAPDVWRWVGDPDAVRYVPLGPLDAPGTVRYVEQLLADANREPRDAYTLGIVANPSGSLVGSVALSIDSRVHRRAELGYILRRDAWGKGLATAAARLVIDFAFAQLGVNRVWAVCDPDNPASMRVLQKAGMAEEGRLRQDLLVRGTWRDSVLFGIVAGDAVEDRAVD